MINQEIQIIIECQKGDLEQFALLYDKYIRKIYDFIYYKTHHRETAEDLTQKTFFKALKKINNFKIKQGYFSAWLYTIARNTVIDYYRTKKNETDINDIWDLSGNTDIEHDFDTLQKLDKVKKYLSEIKSEQRDIIIMRVWQGMSYREIAQVVSKSEASCKMQFSRTINKLRQNMPLAVYLGFIINAILGVSEGSRAAENINFFF